MIQVELANGHTLVISKTHINFVMRSRDSEIEELTGAELKPGMFLPYSLKAYNGKGGNRDLGFFVGAYAGDGSFDNDKTVVFSLNKDDRVLREELIRISEKYFGAHYSIIEPEGKGLLSLRIHSKAAVGLCKDFVEAKGRDKHYTARVFGMSKEFRWGVIEGHLATDGGTRNRIYTSSLKMVQTLNMLSASLGTTTSVRVDERDNRLSDKPVYSVLIYRLNRENYGDFWFKKGDKLWVRIKSITPKGISTGYCFEVENDEPMFTVGTTGILTHNCRLRLDNRELRKRGGGLFGASPMTGSIGVVTINMPRTGYLSRSEEEFLSRLERLMILAKNSLEMKRKVLEDLTEKGLYPYSRVYLSEVKKATGSYWTNHFSTIGLVGMNEACMNFLGVPITAKEGKEWAIKILNFMREKLADFQEETGNLYNLEATPAEGTSYRLAKKDKERFASIFTQGDSDTPYYTNSVHPPVYEFDDIYSLLEHQDDLQVLFTGGTVVHLFLGEPVHDWKIVRELVRRIVERFRLPYFSITPTFSICPVHGYIPGEHHICPYPHTKEELERFGVITELTEEELSRLPENAYIKPEDPGGTSLFLDLGNK
ncbi:hypothetical protein DRQ17_06790 [bacterium]|nr:MAG: hypothetical protein DRQ17_06790 [bacterium]RKZ24477.1 MAG: hypothetical protein DRQ23_00035 [bacterium]